MTTPTRSVSTSVRLLLIAGLVIGGASFLAAPAYASTYAFVNTSGEVNAVVADNPNMALVTAFGISLHSGVMLLSNLADGILNDSVSGV